eukprot:Nk52_evm10s1705 gene=Nk52_evmTU10s1705
MRLDQIITGAVNVGPSTVGLGRIKSPFHNTYIVYASCANVVILKGDLTPVQIIKDAKNGTQVSCVECSDVGCKIAATFEDQVVVYEPFKTYTRKDSLEGGKELEGDEGGEGCVGGELGVEDGYTDFGANGIIGDDEQAASEHPYYWKETATLQLESRVNCISWHPKQNRLITGSNDLRMWEKNAATRSWHCIWTQSLSSPVYYVSFSPDGNLFVSASQYDRLPKVWFQQALHLNAELGQEVPGAVPENPPEVNGNEQAEESVDDKGMFLKVPKGNQKRKPSQTLRGGNLMIFNFVYLPHPRSITSVSWRHSTRSSGCVNALMTTARDKICRIWKETLVDTATRTFHLCTTIYPNELKNSNLPGVSDVHWLHHRELTYAINGGFESKGSLDANGEMKEIVNCDDMVFRIQPDGTLVVWRIEGITDKRQRVPRVCMGTPLANAFPAREARKFCYDVVAFYDPSSISTNELSYGRKGGLNLLCRNKNGMLSTWKLTLADFISHWSVAAVERGPYCSGHHSEIVQVCAHPRLPYLLSMSHHSRGVGGELIVWKVFDVGPVSQTPPPLSEVLRIKSHSSLPFAATAWFPNEICFISLDENQLRFYKLDQGKGACEGGFSSVMDLAGIDARPNVLPSADFHRTLSAKGQYTMDLTSLDMPTCWQDGDTFLYFHIYTAQELSIANTPDDYFALGVHREGRMVSMWKTTISRKIDKSISFSSELIIDSFELNMPNGVSITCCGCPVGQISNCHDRGIDVSFLWVAGCSDLTVRVFNFSADELTQSSIGSWVERKEKNFELRAPPELCDGSPIQLLSIKCAYFARLATVCKIDGRFFITVWECESTLCEFVPEYDIMMEENEVVKSIDWVGAWDGNHILAIGSLNNLSIYSQSVSSFDCRAIEWKRLQCFAPPTYKYVLPSPICVLCWAHGGTLVVASPHKKFVFSKWVSYTESGTSMKESYKGIVNIFNLSYSQAPLLPEYHPRQLFECIMCGKLNRVWNILQELSNYVTKSVSKKQLATGEEICLPSLSVADMQVTGEKTSLETVSSVHGSTSNLSKPSATPAQDYSSLFDAPVIDFSLGIDLNRENDVVEEDNDESPTSDHNQWIYLSASCLAESLTRFRLEGLSSREQMELIALVEVLSDITQHTGSLDELGLRFMVCEKMFAYLSRSLPPAERPLSVSNKDICWAFHSESQDPIVDLLLNNRNLNWSTVSAIGMGLWAKNGEILKKVAEIVAKNEFAENKDPLDAAVFYLAMNKKAVLMNFFRAGTGSNARMFDFFRNDFTTERWQTAALKNAFALLGKRRFVHAAAFFILGDSIGDAVNVCMRNLGDYQLAIFIARLYEGDSGPTFQKLLKQDLMEKAEKENDVWLRSLIYWWLKDFERAYGVLLNMPDHEDKSNGKKLSVCLGDPTLAWFHNFLKGHMFLRTLDMNQGRIIDTSRLLYQSIYAYNTGGCPLLAVDVLPMLTELEKVNEVEQLRLGAQSFSISVKKPTKLLGFGSSAIQPTVKPAVDDAINSGTFDFDNWGFGGTQEPGPAAVQEPEPVVETSVAKCDEERDEEKDSFQEFSSSMLIVKKHFIRILFLRTVIQSLSDFGKHSWEDFRIRLEEDTKALQSMVPNSGFTLEHTLDLLLDYYAIEGNYVLMVKLLGISKPERVEEFLKSIALEIMSTFSYFNPSFSHMTDNSLKKLDYLTTALSQGLQEYLTNDVPEYVQSKRNRLFVCEMFLTIYVGLLLVCWARKKYSRLLTLLINCPSLYIFDNLFSFVEYNANLYEANCSDNDAGVVINVGGSEGEKPKNISSSSRDYETDVLEKASPMSVIDCFLDEVAINEYSDDEDSSPSDAESNSSEIFDSMLAKHQDDIGIVSPRLPLKGKRAVLKDKKKHKELSEVELKEQQRVAYAWSLIKLVTVQFVNSNVRSMVKKIHISLSDIDTISPIIHAALDNLDKWGNIREKALNRLPAPEYLIKPDIGRRQSIGLLRQNTSLLDPNNNPFKKIPAKRRLWHFLMRNSSVRDTVFRYVFRSYAMEEKFASDSSSKVVFKDLDGEPVQSFAISSNSLDHIVVATSKELTELDLSRIDPVASAPSPHSPLFSEGSSGDQNRTIHSIESSLLVAQSYSTNRTNDGDVTDFRINSSMRGSFGRALSNNPNSRMLHSAPASPAGQSNSRASRLSSETIVCAKTARFTSSLVTCMDSHPTIPLYLTGGVDGAVNLWQFDQTHPLFEYSGGLSAGGSATSGKSRVTSIKFSDLGNKFGTSDLKGDVTFYRLEAKKNDNTNPFLRINCHSKATNEFLFLNSCGFFASAGISSDMKNVRLWDSLLPPNKACVNEFICHEGGANCLAYCPSRMLLLSGGRKGNVCIFDIRQRRILHTFDIANDSSSACRSIAVDEMEAVFATGSSDGELKIFNLPDSQNLYNFAGIHGKHRLFSSASSSGISTILFRSGYLFTAGSDGSVAKMKFPPK